MHAHSLGLRQEPVLRLRGRQRSNDLVELSVTLPALFVFDVVNVEHFALVDLGPLKLFVHQEIAKAMPFLLEPFTQVGVARISLCTRDLAPIVYETISLHLDETVTALLLVPTANFGDLNEREPELVAHC